MENAGGRLGQTPFSAKREQQGLQSRFTLQVPRHAIDPKSHPLSSLATDGGGGEESWADVIVPGGPRQRRSSRRDDLGGKFFTRFIAALTRLRGQFMMNEPSWGAYFPGHWSILIRFRPRNPACAQMGFHHSGARGRIAADVGNPSITRCNLEVLQLFGGPGFYFARCQRSPAKAFDAWDGKEGACGLLSRSAPIAEGRQRRSESLFRQCACLRRI